MDFHLLQISPCLEAGWNLALNFAFRQRVEWTTDQEVAMCERHLVVGKMNEICERSWIQHGFALHQ